MDSEVTNKATHTKDWPRSTREDELVLVACVFVLSGLRTGEDSEYQLCWLYSCLLHPFWPWPSIRRVNPFSCRTPARQVPLGPCLRKRLVSYVPVPNPRRQATNFSDVSGVTVLRTFLAIMQAIRLLQNTTHSLGIMMTGKQVSLLNGRVSSASVMRAQNIIKPDARMAVRWQSVHTLPTCAYLLQNRMLWQLRLCSTASLTWQKKVHGVILWILIYIHFGSARVCALLCFIVTRQST